MDKNLKKSRIIITVVIFIILLIGGAGLYYYKTHYITFIFAENIQTEITGTLNRPDCGWYQLYSYYLQPDTPLNTNEFYFMEKDETGYEFRLSLLEFNLAEYSGGELDIVALQNIHKVLQYFTKTNSKVIIRFLYDWDGLGMEKEPDDISIIEGHMEQAGAVLNEYSSLIYTTQGIFVGSWAEMHDSKYLTDESMTALLLQYASVTDPSIYLAVRTPNQYRTIFRELEEHPEKYKKYPVTAEGLKKRLGLYNDGMLGSISDIGTYQAGDTENAGLSEEELRKAELSFQNELCLTVPNGGEAVNDNVYNDGENAVKDLHAMHISYLNRMHDEAVINKWKNTILEQKDSLYHRRSIYEYITDHMGARFVLKDCKLSYQPFRKEDAKGVVTIKNVGFSNLYHPKRFLLTLTNIETGESIQLLDSNEDADMPPLQQWNSGEETKVPFHFSPSDLGDGEYALTAVIKDMAGDEIISFANDSYREELNGYYLGSLTISAPL